MTESPGGDASLGRRILVIGLASVAMLLLVVGLVPRLTRAPADPVPPGPVPGADTELPIAEEAGAFDRAGADFSVDPATEGRARGGSRSLAGFRALRAYPGAPPRIPHEVTDGEFMGTECLQCHGRGGWAPRMGTYTPPTPHPEMKNCLQCHVPQNTEGRFRPTDWVAAPWPEGGRRAMEGSPLVMPHDLTMRGACLACHGGPSAVAEIRTTHPERVNCRQCHVPSVADTTAVFTRPIGVRSGAGDQG